MNNLRLSRFLANTKGKQSTLSKHLVIRYWSRLHNVQFCMVTHKHTAASFLRVYNREKQKERKKKSLFRIYFVSCIIISIATGDREECKGGHLYFYLQLVILTLQLHRRHNNTVPCIDYCCCGMD